MITSFNMIKENDLNIYPKDEYENIIKKQRAIDKIYNTIKIKGSTYPSEIEELTEIGYTTILRNLKILSKRGEIKKINLKEREHIPPLIKMRFDDLFKKGIKGKRLLNISFYIIPNRTLNEYKKELIINELD